MINLDVLKPYIVENKKSYTKSQKKSPKPVWDVNIAVGKGHACIPITDITGIAAVSEHLPNPDKSLINATRFISIFLLKYLF